MKLKHIIATLSLAAVMAVGVGAVASKASAKVEVAEASSRTNIEVRFNLPSSWWGGWTDVYLHTFDEGGTPTTPWRGYQMTLLYYNEDGDKVYSFTADSDHPIYDKIIFNTTGSGGQLPETEAPSTSKGYYYSDNKFGTYDLVSTYYLYDYDNVFNGAPHAYAWNNANSNIKNEEWPASANMTKLSDLSGNGRVYSISLDVKYNKIQFNNGTNVKQVDAGQPSNGHAYVYAPDSVLDGEDTWWDNMDYVFAHNWSMNLLNFRNYSKASGAELDTGACESLYETAKDTYNYFKNNRTEVLTEIKNNFADALERMSDWVIHNHESFTVSEGVGTFSQRVLPVLGTVETVDNTMMIIVIVSLISVSAIVGYVFIRRSKEN